MKKLFLVSFMLMSAVFLTACWKKVDVVDYNDKLVDLTQTCLNAEELIRNAMGEENWELAKTSYTTTLGICKNSQTTAAALEAYKDDSSLRDAVNTVLAAEVAYLEKFGETIVYRDYEELTAEEEATYTALETELTAINQTLRIATENLLSVQETFATKHGYQLLD